MRLLAMDTSGLVASVAVTEDDLLLGEYTIDYKKTHSQTLLPMLDAVSEMLELDMGTLSAIAVAAGPGSFTGLRIGSATAKGLGLALGLPLIAVPTVDALAANLWGHRQQVCPIMDARRGQTYTGLYRFGEGGLETLVPQCAVDFSDILSILNERKEPVTFLGDGVPVFRGLIEQQLKVPYAFAPAGYNRQRAASVALLGAVYFKEGRCVSAEEFRPEYLRLSQAEREQREDARRLAEISAEAFAHSWDAEAFMEAFTSDTKECLLLRDAKNVALGYCVLSFAADEGEILSIAVAEEYRHQGYGAALLQKAFLKAAALGLHKIFLEVRATNAPAIACYERAGFVREGVRRGYYQEIGEDALIYSYTVK